MNYHLIIREIVLKAILNIRMLDNSDLSLKPSPTKWSKKETVGHLIDSAYNNHQRIIRAEKQGNLLFQGYDQDDWVAKNNYQHRDMDDLLNMWEMTNRHLAILIENTGDRLLNRKFTQHNFHEICMDPLPAQEAATLSYLIRDYIFHMEHHLVRIIPDYERIGEEFRSSAQYCQSGKIIPKVRWLAFR